MIDTARMTTRARLPRAAVRGLMAAVAYVAVVVAVTLVERQSELAKFSRGTYTDTFSPLLFTRLLTLPGSIVARWPGYPVDGFDDGLFRAVLTDAAQTAFAVTALQALLLGALVALRSLRRSVAR